MLELLRQILALIVAAGIVNVWLIRFGKSTQWRGGDSKSLKEEFEAYGLPYWFMLLIGVLKLSFAALLVVSLWIPALMQPAAIGMAFLMAGAVTMHVRVGDPLLKSLPAATMLAMSLFVAFA